MADDADKAPEAAVTTPGDAKKDGTKPTLDATAKPEDKAPGSFTDEPKKPGRPKGSKNKASLPTDPAEKSKAWLQKKLIALLVAPSFGFEVMGEQWPAEHIDKAGPDLAREIANYAERNPAMRLRLIAFLEGGETAGLVFAAAMYVAPLGMYFGVIPAPARVKAMLSVPERGGEAVEFSPDGFGPPTPEALQREAEEKGFDDVGEYMTAVQEAIGGVRKS